MKKLTITIILFVVSITLLQSTTMTSPTYDGPFGLQMGLSVEQLLRLDPSAVQENEYTWTVTPPLPHPKFGEYIIKIHPDYGIFQIIAISNIIETSVYGTEIKSEFFRIESGLSTKYGQPTHQFDFLLGGSIWDEPRDFMMALISKEYKLNSFWNPVQGSECIRVIALESFALTIDSGVLKLSYESKVGESAINAIVSEEDSSF